MSPNCNGRIDAIKKENIIRLPKNMKCMYTLKDTLENLSIEISDVKILISVLKYSAGVEVLFDSAEISGQIRYKRSDGCSDRS